MSIIYTNRETIEIPFPKKVFDSYLKKFNLNSEEELNNVNIFFVIKNCYKDFKIGILSLDDFSNIGGYFFGKLEPDSKSSRFGGVLLDIGELNFYIRNSNSKPKFTEISDFLSSIEEYFKNH